MDILPDIEQAAGTAARAAIDGRTGMRVNLWRVGCGGGEAATRSKVGKNLDLIRQGFAQNISALQLVACRMSQAAVSCDLWLATYNANIVKGPQNLVLWN